MNAIADFLASVLSGALKLLLVLAASVFVISFLLAALVAVVLVSLWSLVTGRKPAPVVMFNRMRAQSRRYTQGAWQNRTTQPARDVVDVEATDVTDVPRSPASHLR